MLNPKLKLNPKIFNADCEQVPTRKGFGQGMTQAAESNKNIVGLSADLSESTGMSPFTEKFPDRFVQVGVAEQNLVTVASGLAAMGKIPFCSSFAIFSPGRNWEQIRTTIAYNDRKVVIVGSHAGLSDGPDGGTHQALEDIGLMRMLPNMEVVNPCDALEAKRAAIALSKTKKPSYLRVGRVNVPIITTEETPFEVGKAEIYWLPDVGLAQVGIIVTGVLTSAAIFAAKELENPQAGGEGIKVKVMNLSSIKPIDKDAIIALAKETKKVVTVEEHQIAGGMGSAVAEVLAQNFPVAMEFVGVKDQFGQTGQPEELMKHYGIDKNAIKEAVKRIILRKQIT
ncbi:transketolase [Candidatus Nomurabacteria bacterium RIFCSPLOWO2_02_FULL_40_10]|uniref:Transketolase n=2 Tax=Candidatus Nomuraibacteriota TaxID=1752729 RepID=A0A1F6XZZ9_9BACT|nr:MAG: transketolase [Candidatus Nomurabacteria bacterium RIFCSPHIGHO2_01_FULL_39_10]OGI99695.1 MAG: transketolase [Candidatus Nomurabacteria bacterium RIFCSPLOWO2_02_FULL_40_10]